MLHLLLPIACLKVPNPRGTTWAGLRLAKHGLRWLTADADMRELVMEAIVTA